MLRHRHGLPLALAAPNSCRAPLQEDDVGVRAHGSLPSRERLHPLVVEVVPAAIWTAHTAGRCVVAVAKGTQVVGDADGGVQGAVPLRGSAMGREVQLGGRRYQPIYLPEGTSAAVELKALQVKDQHWRQLPEVHLLLRIHLLATHWAEPLVARGQQLRLRVLLDGLGDAVGALGDRHGEVEEGLEPPGAVAATAARHGGADLALQKVDKEGLAALEVPLPGQGRGVLLLHARPVREGLLLPRTAGRGRTVQVRVQGIEAEGQKLLDVLLLARLEEVRCQWRELRTEGLWVMLRSPTPPELVLQLSESFSNFTAVLGGAGAVRRGLVFPMQEILPQGLHVAEALQACVHEAAIARIP
mmetsp:Transcript_98716/g.318335  ORF Transcript_98716/g.318335 Transcript_98716/m.318335 type:complete len:357 (-) Transcript_98716:95-1165(-)